MMSRERLAAFADGELSPEEAAEVVMYLADHPEDQAWVDEVMAANAALAQAFAGPMSEPVPPAIRAAIMGDAPAVAPAVPSARILPFRRRAAAWGGLALAASIAGLALILPQSGPSGGPADLVPGPVAQGGALWQALNASPSGVVQPLDGGEMTILASLPVEGGFCREVEVIDRAGQSLTVALACTQGNGWQVHVALSEPLPETETGFVAAGGPETQAFDLWLDRMGAGMALGPDEEARAIADGWAR